ncbi:MAG: NAD(P)/FAD-dependent oxidoreductase [Candidatus Geothermarchaeales archaeon]
MGWDVVIAGASFAGLATATEIRAKAVILDRYDLGTHETSACGTFVRILKEFGCEEAILRTFDSIFLHAPRPNHIRLVEPLCTFDYRRLCERLFARGRAKFTRVTVRGVQGKDVITDAGPFTSRCLVDATGWSAVLTNGAMRRDRCLAFGLEVDTDWEDEAMHFIVNPRIVRKGVAWIFPTDAGSRVGVASYGPTNTLRSSLKAFLHRLGAEGYNLHGGAIPWDLQGGAHGKVFLVGDAAGLALPLTLEGIRRSLQAGRLCGRIVNEVIQDRISLEEGLQQYDASVLKGERAYRLLASIQRNLGKGLDPLIGYMCRPRALQKLYLGV